MSDIVIKVENLSKQYRLGTVGTGTLSHDLNRFLAKLRGKEDPYLKIGERNDRTIKGDNDYVWALRDINFEIKQGEVLGIVGRNGAGKSTLLKILSQITRPSSGSVKMKGRVGSLLEVGTGFHPDLTGRENIYINGAILGMRKWEINKRLDEIIDFAGIERYIDTPVKRYSSGMMVRLGFAVAAHLEPEILIVDEVLAVGDAEFQKKCLGKMGEVSKNDGRTILFVSHNLNAITSLCQRGVLLTNGTLSHVGTIQEVVGKYLNHDNVGMRSSWKKDDAKSSNPWFDIEYMGLEQGGGQVEYAVSRQDQIELKIIARIAELDPALTIGYAIYDEKNEPLYWSLQTDSNVENWPKLQTGINTLVTKIPTNLLNEGTYYLEPIGGLYFREWLFEPGKTAIRIKLSIQGGLSESPYYQTVRPTSIAPILLWQNL